jgi:hypothetical protein
MDSKVTNIKKTQLKPTFLKKTFFFPGFCPGKVPELVLGTDERPLP